MRLGTAIERLVDNYRYASDKEWIRDKVAWALYHTWKEADDRNDEPNSSEIPNNCEHITEDGVTCAKYPACDDCPDNPLNKVKGSERLVKGKNEPMKTTDYCDICKRDMCEICIADATNPYCVPSHYEISYEPKDEPQTDCAWK